MKKLIFVLGVLVFVIIALIAAGKFFIKGSVEEKISKLIGLPAKIDSLETGYFIKIKGLKIKNPEGFSNDTMMDISSVNIDKNLGEMDIRVKSLLVEKSQTGRVNIDYLKPTGENLGDINIKKFKMHLEKVHYKDGITGKMKDYDVNLSRQYENLPGPGSAIDIIVRDGTKGSGLPKDEGIIPPKPEETLPPGEIIPPGDTTPPGDGGDTTPPRPGWGGGWDQ